MTLERDRIKSVVMFIVLLAAITPPSNAASQVTISGAYGQKLSIPRASFSQTSTVVVTGRGFDETVGIYLAYCLLPKDGGAPTPCGGGVNKKGIGQASHWISSNPPPYGVGLAIPFLPGGRFSQSVVISKKIGNIDCTKVKCAIAIRSDHLHEGDRTNDLFIPITFKSTNKK